MDSLTEPDGRTGTCPDGFGESAERAGSVSRDEAARLAFVAALFVGAVPPSLGAGSSEFFDLSLLRSALSSAGLCDAGADDATIQLMYLSRSECRLVSANPIFDENWYRSRNPDVVKAIETKEALCGFWHFINYGIHEGRWPNYSLQNAASDVAPAPRREAIDEDLYLSLNPQVRTFLAAFPLLTPTQHYNIFGRRIDLAIKVSGGAPENVSPLALVTAQFDPEWYAQRYAAILAESTRYESALEHYLTEGARQGLSPNSWFQEDWYCAYYSDVHQAIKAGTIPFGFFHYIWYGQAESRMPAYDLENVLEASLPTVTEPTLLHRLPGLRERLNESRIHPRVTDAVPDEAKTVWFLMPVLNPDIAFGGYQACFALMVAARRSGFKIAILCNEEDRPNQRYFIWRQKSKELRDVIAGCRVFGRADLADLAIARGDLFVAYSVWNLKLAARLAHFAGDCKPFLLAQEYEPIFYENNALRAVCAEFYSIDHHAIINSRFLLRYLQKNRIGLFARDPTCGSQPQFTVFEHRINRLSRQSAAEMTRRKTRVLVAYARPEAHAGRNLFEMIVLALETLCQDGVFGSEWSFVGLGALSEIPDVPLGYGHVLKLNTRMDEADYAECMSAMDVGISMMAAPHPSVVPFEFATTGALVVTNVFENRSAEELIEISGNIVPCEMKLASMIEAIRAAVLRVDKVEDREALTYAPAQKTWDEIFSDEFVRTLFGP